MRQATRPTLEELVALGDQACGGSSAEHPDEAVNDAAALIACATGQLTLHVARASGSIDFRGWFSPAGALLASETGAPGAGALRLAVLPVERLAARVARLVELGPRPDSAVELQLVIARNSFDAMLSGSLAGASDAVERAVGAPSGELPWLAGAFASPDLTHWRLAVEGTGAHADSGPRAEIDVLDAPSSSLWLLLGETDAPEVILVSTTPRALWIALTTVLPCWDGANSDGEQQSSE